MCEGLFASLATLIGLSLAALALRVQTANRRILDHVNFWRRLSPLLILNGTCTVATGGLLLYLIHRTETKNVSIVSLFQGNKFEEVTPLTLIAVGLYLVTISVQLWVNVFASRISQPQNGLAYLSKRFRDEISSHYSKKVALEERISGHLLVMREIAISFVSEHDVKHFSDVLKSLTDELKEIAWENDNRFIYAETLVNEIRDLSSLSPLQNRHQMTICAEQVCVVHGYCASLDGPAGSNWSEYSKIVEQIVQWICSELDSEHPSSQVVKTLSDGLQKHLDIKQSVELSEKSAVSILTNLAKSSQSAFNRSFTFEARKALPLVPTLLNSVKDVGTRYSVVKDCCDAFAEVGGETSQIFAKTIIESSWGKRRVDCLLEPLVRGQFQLLSRDVNTDVNEELLSWCQPVMLAAKASFNLRVAREALHLVLNGASQSYSKSGESLVTDVFVALVAAKRFFELVDEESSELRKDLIQEVNLLTMSDESGQDAFTRIEISDERVINRIMTRVAQLTDKVRTERKKNLPDDQRRMFDGELHSVPIQITQVLASVCSMCPVTNTEQVLQAVEFLAEYKKVEVCGSVARLRLLNLAFAHFEDQSVSEQRRLRWLYAGILLVQNDRLIDEIQDNSTEVNPVVSKLIDLLQQPGSKDEREECVQQIERLFHPVEPSADGNQAKKNWIVEEDAQSVPIRIIQVLAFVCSRCPIGYEEQVLQAVEFLAKHENADACVDSDRSQLLLLTIKHFAREDLDGALRLRWLRAGLQLVRKYRLEHEVRDIPMSSTTNWIRFVDSLAVEKSEERRNRKFQDLDVYFDFVTKKERLPTVKLVRENFGPNGNLIRLFLSIYADVRQKNYRPPRKSESAVPVLGVW